MGIFQSRLPWYVAGPLLAVLVIALQWAANLPLGATGAIASLPSRLRGRLEAGDRWRLFFFAGMILGGFLFALSAGDFQLQFSFGRFNAWLGDGWIPLKALVLAGAGLMIGFGARTAGGCTSGHGICGFSRGSKGSMVSTLTFVGAAVVTAHLLRWVLDV